MSPKAHVFNFNFSSDGPLKAEDRLLMSFLIFGKSVLDFYYILRVWVFQKCAAAVFLLAVRTALTARSHFHSFRCVTRSGDLHSMLKPPTLKFSLSNTCMNIAI